jgi:ATP-dependent RNA helicase DHX57
MYSTTKKCPVLKIPGFTYPVESFYLEDIVKQTQYNIPRHMLKKKTSKDHENKEEATDVKGVEEELWTRFDDSHIDYDLFVHVVTYLIEQQEQKSQNLGSILVFLPGTAEIKRLIEAFSQSKEISSKIWALPLHGSLSASDQSVVFRNAPKGKYKIIVSTNIAETSITINDVTAVLDCGKLKEMVYDSTNRRSQLLDTWASKAGCDQRKGRAGRVQAGQCYRFFTKKRWSNLANQLAAEIHRVSLEQLCLQIKKLELGPIRKFLSKAIEPPEEHAVDAAIQGLLEIGAFTRQQKGQHEVSLTPLGNHLAMLPMDARLGKFLVFGSILRCVEPVAMIASCISNRSPFTMTSDPEIRAKQEQTKKEMVIGHSDHLLMWKLMEAYHELKGQKNKRTFCKEKGVSFEAMETILDLKDQYLTQLETIGFYETKSVDNHWNENAKTPRIIKAALCAGLFANVIQVWYPEQKYFQSAHGVFTEQHEAKKLSYWIRSTPSSSDDHSPSQTRERVFLHPTSCNFQANQYDSPWLLYSDLVQTSKLFVRDSTMVHPYALLLFGDQLKVVHEQGELHLLEGWIRFKAVARIGVLIKSIRLHLDQLLLEKIETPQLDIAQR